MLLGTVHSAEPAPPPQAIREPVARFLKQHCYECHAGDKPSGERRLDQLSNTLNSTADRELWQTVYDRIRSGEMPPKDQPRPSADEVRDVTQAIAAAIRDALHRERATAGRVVLRRLNRTEYQNTIRDLLGVKVEFRDLLPLDSSAEGFDNVSDALHVSSFLIERYLEAANLALDLAIANRPQPPSIKKRYSLKETHHIKSTQENVIRKSADDDRVVLFSSSAWQSVVLSPFYPPDGGNYRFRLSVAGVQSGGKPVTFRVDAGMMLMTGKPHLVSYFDAPPDESRVVEFVDALEPRNTIRILPYGLAAAQTVHKVGAEQWQGPGLAVDWVEVEGPLHEQWPPESHRRLFGDLPQAPAPSPQIRERVEVVSSDPSVDAQRVLEKFVRRAFRRAVKADDVQPYVTLFETKLATGRSFEQALRVALAAVMVSPDFLFLREEPGRLSDAALASRLSYFLWSAPPDDRLLEQAERGRLHDPIVLRGEVERLLADPRSSAFVENFVGQWLGLRDIDFTVPSHILYPEFDDMLKVSMIRETELFFMELLKHDLGLVHFLSSDFSMLNGRLAKHYGINGVEGWEFRRVPLPADSHRGGVLTMASVLKVTANGTSTSPVTRGAWVLERILGTPPPKPPGNVEGLVPDIRGATTIRQQLAKHRQIESCARCHVQIDPPGFALESFDVIGGWREYYRSSGNGKPVTIDGRRMHYLQGPAVDPSDVLPDGRQFRDIDDFKKLLVENVDQFARALTSKLLTYGTGAAPAPSDRAALDAIVGRMREKNGGLRTLIHEIVQDELFRTK